MAQKQIGLRLDPGELERVERARGEVPRNRWIECRLVEVLDGLESGGPLTAEQRADLRGIADGQTTVEEQVASSGRRSGRCPQPSCGGSGPAGSSCPSCGSFIR